MTIVALLSYFTIVEMEEKEKEKVPNTHAALPLSDQAIWTSLSSPLNRKVG